MKSDDRNLFIEGCLDDAHYRGSDKTMSLRYVTREVTLPEIGIISGFVKMNGMMGFSPEEYSRFEIPQGEIKIKGKSPSQKLRNTLYVLHNKAKIDEDFEVWYVRIMTEIIQKYQDKIYEYE